MLVSSEAPPNSNEGENPSQNQNNPQCSSPITLKFVDVSYRVKLHGGGGKSTSTTIMNMLGGGTDVENPVPWRLILNGITGTAAPGRLLAILGPSGSGKSTLLNALAGRLHHGLAGAVLFNGRKFRKQIVKKTGFVAQDDVLYPHLTVRETLVFCSLLRIPVSVRREEKAAIAELGLAPCADTVIGNGFVRGVSGGERKRVSIAHEMLVDPSLLILDEPTSGLDATAAHHLVAVLGCLAARGKTVLMSVHQPSSRVYQMFDGLLLLSEGRCIYFGTRAEATPYFDSVGFSPVFPMNPADFLLDLASGLAVLEQSMIGEPADPFATPLEILPEWYFVYGGSINYASM